MKNFILIIFFFWFIICNAQNIGINSSGAPADASAILDVSSNSMGFLIPRMTTAEKLLIVVPADGLMVYDTDLKTFYYYDAIATTWRSMYSSAAASSLTAWSISGNAGIIDGTDYIGTNGAVDLDFRTNAIERMTISGLTGFIGINKAAPLVSLDVNGAISLAPTSVALTVDGQAVVVSNVSFLNVTSNSASAVARTISLGAGAAIGQILIIMSIDTDAARQFEVRTGVGTIKLPAGGCSCLGFNNAGDNLFLVWNGTNWIQIGVSGTY